MTWWVLLADAAAARTRGLDSTRRLDSANFDVTFALKYVVRGSREFLRVSFIYSVRTAVAYVMKNCVSGVRCILWVTGADTQGGVPTQPVHEKK